MNIIVSALAAGATAGAADLVSTVGGDLYQRLVSAVKDRFAGKPEAEEVADAIDMLEKKPDSEARQGVVTELLEAEGAGEDETLLELAGLLLTEVGPSSSQVQATQTATGRNVIQQVGDGSAAIVDKSRERE